MKVIITKELALKHSDYGNGFNCPLYHAIREQYPNFEFECIGGFGRIWLHKHSVFIKPIKGDWSGEHFEALAHGLNDYPEITDQIELEYDLTKIETFNNYLYDEKSN